MSVYKILCLSRNQNHLFKPLYGVEKWEVIETDKWESQEIDYHQPDILITPSCDWFESDACIKRAKELQIPTLLIIDGIIEWRHQWENPKFGMGGRMPLNQPVTTDKIACLGWQSARTLESWGNIGKCEVTGSPRFDIYQGLRKSDNQAIEKKKLLIMTSNTPSFTPEQAKIIDRSIIDAKQNLHQSANFTPIWRLRRGLEEKHHLTDNFPHLRNLPLYEVLPQVDAVITTPSTTALEAMLSGLPTAILDYTNSPAYLQSAWTITSPDHWEQVLPELYTPPTSKMVFQDEVLSNNLECISPSLPRFQELVEKMIYISKAFKKENKPAIYPHAILNNRAVEHGHLSSRYILSKLYTNHPILKNEDITFLQRELIIAKQEVQKMRDQLNNRNISHLFSRLIIKVLKKKTKLL